MGIITTAVRVGNGTTGGVGIGSVEAGAGVTVTVATVGDAKICAVIFTVGLGTAVGKKLNGSVARHASAIAAKVMPATNMTTNGRYERTRFI